MQVLQWTFLKSIVN